MKMGSFALIVIIFASCWQSDHGDRRNRQIKINEDQKADLFGYLEKLDLEKEGVYWIIPITGCSTCIESSLNFISGLAKRDFTMILPVQNQLVLREYEVLVNSLSESNTVVFDHEFTWERHDLGTIAPMIVKLKNEDVIFIYEIAASQDKIMEALKISS